MKISLRNATLKDSKLIAQLSNQLGYNALISDIEHRLKIILEHPENCIYVATENEKVVGWIHGFYTMRVESDFFVEIGGLVVDENFQNNGIGKKLVSKVIEWAELNSCKKIRVRCNVIRTESHLFYKKIGFELNKEQKIFNKPLK
ncbi:GNAT family N-acetyltransferase [Flammeovirga sp. SJP92]|uniref:GNAT family N-acetyltransferase n=1 Tax=Flammeovirga sp. SJP92 TaxID=1775430 RepID=UPI0007896E58|nr:GNAT family N-acetyltransferase [Flammeovirga sp. SJP92]KXX71066.1 GCN5 family acetyltransferase [Flammeovirga sp. SJP92]